ncbi:MAG: TerB family tellurite resistance protein [Bryobacteraceae bacterium]
MSIWKLLGFEKTAGQQTPQTEAVRRITEALGEMEPERANYVAAFAYILSRVAHADLKVTEAETREMERIVQELGGLTPEQARIAVSIAKVRSKDHGATENFLVTKEFDRMATREQKLALLHCLFAVSASEESISTIEENEIRQIATELSLEHREFIAVRYSFRDRIAVLQQRREGSDE